MASRRPDRQGSVRACVRGGSAGVVVCVRLCLQMAIYILCKPLRRVQLYQESANIQAVRAAGAFLCNFVSVHCLSSTSRRPKFVVCVSDPASWSSV